MCTPTISSLYFLSGFLFLLLVYTLLSTQPFFIGGIDDVDSAKKSALGGMALFAVCLTASLAWMYKSSRVPRGQSDGGGTGGRYALVSDDYGVETT